MIRTIYGFDDLGRKVPTGSYDDGFYPVGGRIFYIDPTSDETVKFYDSSFNELSSVAVGDTPSYYKVTSAGVSGKEKYYVYNPNISASDNIIWGYYGITTGANGLNIGTGKSATATVLAIEDTSGYSTNSVWTWIKDQRDNNLGNCSDWYVGSQREMEQLETYVINNADGSTIIDFFSGHGSFYAREDASDTSNRAIWWNGVASGGGVDKTYVYGHAYAVAIRSF